MFQKNISLKQHTGFKIGGPAKYFFEAKNLKDLIKAIKEAKRLKTPIFILGGGSKLLVADKGYKGLVIKIKNSKIKIQNDNSKFKIYCEAGTALGRLVAASIKAGLTGLEWAVKIPGTIGGAIHGNSGAFGSSISEIVKSVTALNSNNLKIKKYSCQQCRFGYRDSVFSAKGGPASGGKQNQKLIILSVELQLKKGDRQKSLERIKEYVKRRRERIPVYPSVGSIFKNQKSKIKNQKLLEKFPELKKVIKKGAIPAAWFIEKCGLKGGIIGGAKISEKHANIIVNFNKAKAKDVSALINLVKKQVKKKFGIDLRKR
jgi:UDP-N-acetylmuramate dehydrogenase